MITKAFLRGAAERSIKTFFQTLVAYFLLVVGSGDIPLAGIHELPWVQGLSLAAAATAMSVFTSLAGADFVAGQPVTAGPAPERAA